MESINALVHDKIQDPSVMSCVRLYELPAALQPNVCTMGAPDVLFRHIMWNPKTFFSKVKVGQLQ